MLPGRGPNIEEKLGENMRTPANMLGPSSSCQDVGSSGKWKHSPQARVNRCTCQDTGYNNRHNMAQRHHAGQGPPELKERGRREC